MVSYAKLPAAEVATEATTDIQLHPFFGSMAAVHVSLKAIATAPKDALV